MWWKEDVIARKRIPTGTHNFRLISFLSENPNFSKFTSRMSCNYIILLNTVNTKIHSILVIRIRFCVCIRCQFTWRRLCPGHMVLWAWRAFVIRSRCGEWNSVNMTIVNDVTGHCCLCKQWIILTSPRVSLLFFVWVFPVCLSRFDYFVVRYSQCNFNVFWNKFTKRTCVD